MIRGVANFLTGVIVDSFPEGEQKPGMVLLLIASESEEHPGTIEIDACVKSITAITPEGAEMITELARGIPPALRAVTDDMASARGAIVINHVDIANALDAMERDARKSGPAS